MSFAEELKSIRQHCFLSQEAFARELNVSFSSVNRWESGRAKPNLAAIKSIRDFCDSHHIDFSVLEKAWFDMNRQNKGEKDDINA